MTPVQARGFIIPNPIDELEEHKKNEEFQEGIVRASTMIEHFGLMQLAEHFRKRRIDVSPNRLNRLTLDNIIFLLYATELVDAEGYRNLMRVKRARNRLVHTISKRYDMSQSNARTMLNLAIRSVEVLI